MTELLKNDPISLRYCLLYVFLQNKSVDRAYSNFCAAVGEDIVNEEEFYWHIHRFNQGIFEYNAKPVTNMRRILRKDKKALRVCVMYEWLSSKKTTVFAKYDNLCKVLGKFAMNYQEFDFWFYRFVNGEFDLNFERDKEQKVYELADMPLDIMSNIVEYLDIFDRMSLEKTSQSLRLFSQDQKVFHPYLKFDVYDNGGCIDFGKEDHIVYNKKGNNCVIKYRGRVKVLRGVSSLKQALQDFKKILENPKLYLQALTIWSWREDSESSERYIEDALKLTHLLHVQHLSLRTKSNPLLNILPSLKPGYLTTITINTDHEEVAIEEIIEMDQWKQAKHLDMRISRLIGPLRRLYHFEEFYASCWNLSVEDAREMKEILLKSPDFKKCDMDVRNPIDPNLILQVFGGPIEGSIDTCHYPIPNTTEYFEISFDRWEIVITRKNI